VGVSRSSRDVSIGWGTTYNKAFGSSKQLLKVAFVVNKAMSLGRLGLFRVTKLPRKLPRYVSSHDRESRWTVQTPMAVPGQTLHDILWGSSHPDGKGDRHAARTTKLDDLIFASPKGLSINDRNFRNRAWVTILEQCHIECWETYAVRYSAISHALSNGANPRDLAEQTGHDKRVLLSTYAHAINNQSLFVEF
jgi:hypothetical protein